jgi:hypothetical protein
LFGIQDPNKQVIRVIFCIKWLRTQFLKIEEQIQLQHRVAGQDPDSIGSVDPDPQEGKNAPQKKNKFKKNHVLKCWMFSFES